MVLRSVDYMKMVLLYEKMEVMLPGKVKEVICGN